ncbi:MAG: pyridoxamine 5'-phosphate oxidase [Salinisphaeraceae bacterium]|nr:pyridoxamine 5'-phosphate oxidase [Salinisphaeraceae bacterium]
MSTRATPPGWQPENERDDLVEGKVPAEPFSLFEQWFETAIAAEMHEPSAMTLATANAQGRPSARIVLLKGYSPKGFDFYTNYKSHKGNDLAENPFAALVLWWDKLERQIRIEGRVERLPAADSDAYFASRPRGGQLGAAASHQSQPVADRETLEAQMQTTQERFANTDVSRPGEWGGYRLIAERIEFWQGRRNRLHDRLLYQADGDSWQIQRLQP